MEPIAKRLKQSAESALAGISKKQKDDDIAERIRRLEQDLDSSSDSDSDTSDGKDASDNGSANKSDATGVVSLSALASERIEALPETMLPPKRKTALPTKSDSRKRPSETDKQLAILEMVTAPKKVPFQCKPCAFIGKNMEDFNAHRETPEHLARQQNPSKNWECKLCSKSFTSQSQLDEHRVGKWHQQRAQQKKERHVVKICYDFMRGSCQRGENCAFAHTETKAMKSGKALEHKKKRVCDNFMRTQSCRFGEKCLFSHSS